MPLESFNPQQKECAALTLMFRLRYHSKKHWDTK